MTDFAMHKFMFRSATACFPFFRSAHGDHAHTCNSRWHNELRTSLRASMNQKNSPLECEAENASGQYVKGSQTTLFLLALCMSWIEFHTQSPQTDWRLDNAWFVLVMGRHGSVWQNNARRLHGLSTGNFSEVLQVFYIYYSPTHQWS